MSLERQIQETQALPVTPIQLPTVHWGGYTIRGTAQRPLEQSLRDIVRAHEQQATPRPERVGRKKQVTRKG